MTECERIIEQGILPASFFEEEVRCDFLITKKRKKIWAIELDIYLKFAEVCKKHNLKFWGDGGTMLGAVRHNGFIPWDDDMDVIMPREDYNKLITIGSSEFCDPYFLQTPHTDPNYGYSFAKLRNSNTTCIPKVFAKAGYNHGIHIDIFPLDEIKLDTYENDRKRITECIMKCSSFMKRNSVNLLDERQLENFNKFKTNNPVKEYDVIQEIASNPSNRGTGYVANCTVTTLKSEAQIWKKRWWDKTIMHTFETIKIPIPAEIDERLRTQYGDYLKLPPIEKRGLWHSDVLWDPDKPYIDYCKKNKIMTKVVTYGTFDYFHYGHYSLLERAKALGDYLIVGISSDAMARSKGKATLLTEERRMQIVSNLKFVDEVILENNMEQKVDDIKKYGINIFVLGSDYKELFPQMPEYQELIDAGCKVVFLERTPDISTTELKKKMIQQERLDSNKDSLHNKTKE